jgi:L-lactate dehydrogenase complex protein LldG
VINTFKHVLKGRQSMDGHRERAAAARDVVLGRIRSALTDVDPDLAEPPIPRAYRQVDEAPRDAIIAQFIERVGEYKASVQETTAAELPHAIAAAVARRGVQRLVVPSDLPEDWLPAEMRITPLRDETPLDYDALDTSDGVLTACALGIAQTGTIVLDGGPAQGRRALSLIPDYHLCVIKAEQIVGIVPEAIAALATRANRPITFISGPSATSDIELNRVEGVHGPRTLEVLVVRPLTTPVAS